MKIFQGPVCDCTGLAFEGVFCDEGETVPDKLLSQPKYWNKLCFNGLIRFYISVMVSSWGRRVLWSSHWFEFDLLFVVDLTFPPPPVTNCCDPCSKIARRRPHFTFKDIKSSSAANLWRPELKLRVLPPEMFQGGARSI